MSLQTGAEMGPYEIVAPLGAGGMGEVYRARDTRLDREVAIKILPDHFASDPERVARFEREAKVLASLNHPHIAAIHGFEECGGARFLVLELVEGETLSERIRAGVIPVPDTLRFARQIAEALEAAHDSGVIHRDLKPANIKLTHDGKIKVLDFGLAKALAADTSPTGTANSPTITADFTRQGVVLGTAAYMSPEQARGKSLDKRTDVWSFGCVLYECLTGTKPFAGETTSDMIARILERDPDWTALPADTPPVVQLLLRRCLAKERNRRLRDMGDARVEIEEAIADPTGSSLSLAGAALAAHAHRAESKRGTARFAWALALILLVSTATLGALLVRNLSEQQPVIRASISPPTGSVFNIEATSPGPPAISPDGKRLAFSALDSDGKVRLYLRSLDSVEASPLPSTEGAAYPFWSPSNRSIGFFANGKLKTISAEGGAPFILCNASNGKGGTWNRDGTIVFAPAHNTPLHRVPQTGGDSVAITQLDTRRGDNSHRHPRFLPDGTHLLFLARTPGAGVQGYAVLVCSLDGTEEKLLLRSSAAAEFASDCLLYMRDRTLVAHPFDLQSFEWTADPIPLAQDVNVLMGAAAGVFTASDNGILVHQSVQGTREGARLEWYSRTGERTGQLGDEAEYVSLNISPDAGSIAVDIVDHASGMRDIWIFNVARGIRTRFTFDPGDDVNHVWTPDGESVIFASNRGEQYNLYRKTVGQTGESDLLYESAEFKFPLDCSPDGKQLLFAQTDDIQLDDLWVLPLSADAKPKPFIQTNFEENNARFSPDGKWVVYTSDKSGRDEIYVTSFPDRAATTQVTMNGGAYVWWRNDGKEIIYQTFTGEVSGVEIDITGDVPVVGAETLLFKATPPFDLYPTIHPAPDGQRFLSIARTAERASAPLTVTVNWTEELKR